MREWLKRMRYYFKPREVDPRSKVSWVSSDDKKWLLPNITPKVPDTRRSTTLSTSSVNKNDDAPDNTLTNMMIGAIAYDAISSDRGSDHGSSSYDSSSSSSSYDSGSSSDCGSSSSDGGGSCGGCD